MSDLLAGRGIGITGGGGHLGRAMALAAARAGAIVVIAGRRADPLAAVRDTFAAEGATGPGRIVPVTADIGTDAGLAAMLDAVEAEAGHLDGWVNNAYSGRTGRLGELRREEVEAILARGLADVLMATQEAAARMTAGGAIVNVASMYALVSPQPDAYRAHPEYHNPAAYGAAKAGVVAFTRYAAVHLADRSIRVNAIAPGPFPADAVAGDTAFVAELARRTPLGRIGRPEELGGALVFLLGDEASYVTGQTLVVDGGWTAW